MTSDEINEYVKNGFAACGLPVSYKDLAKDILWAT
jgi:hypothetical protein